ncbi:hypothetical protein SDC9_160657 [bioreactor metagenome]|uniref:Uncharacterized protein n=1 Tax=bioreactor metagenome TaxID=1076179 RepID=A0A645FI78_9ZZZZ
MELIGKAVPRPPSTITDRIPALDHEIGDDPMEFQTVIIWRTRAFQVQCPLCQTHEIRNRHGSLVKLETDGNLPARCSDMGIKTIVIFFTHLYFL